MTKYSSLCGFMGHERTLSGGWENLSTTLKYVSFPVKSCLVVGGSVGYECPHILNEFPTSKYFSVVDLDVENGKIKTEDFLFIIKQKSLRNFKIISVEKGLIEDFVLLHCL